MRSVPTFGRIARGLERWTMYVQDRASGEIAGFTEVVWNREHPELVEQGDTGMFPEYRNRGLGRWLKAAMIKKVIQERPQVKFVDTGNATANASMLRINEELGFRPIMTAYTWQVKLETLQSNLASSR